MQDPVISLDTKRLAEQSAEAASLLRALGNEQRLLILCHLAAQGELSVTAIGERMSLSQSALSQHLGVLREANVVTTTREAQSIRYELSSGAVTRIIEILYNEFCAA